MKTDDKIQELQRLEERLLHADVRRDRSALEQLLAADFMEIGASGRCYDRAAVIDALAGETTPTYRVSDYQVRWLGSEHALATYRVIAREADGSARTSLRSSVWQLTSEGWALLFHQGTAAAQASQEADSENQ